jgi:hypothetical protein
MPARFAPAPDTIGFDATAFPPAVVVPVGGEVKIWLEDGSNLPLRVYQDAPAKAAISEQPHLKASRQRTITVQGKAAGVAQVFAGSGERAPVVEIFVLPKQELSVQFYHLKDTAGHATPKPRPLNSMITAANALLVPQTNIAVVAPNATVAEKTLPGDLGKKIVIDPPRGDAFADKLRSIRGPGSAKFHVFFVWDFDDGSGSPSEGMTNPSRQVCWITHTARSVAGSIGRILAHEVCHLLINKITGPDVGLDAEGRGLRQRLRVDVHQHSSNPEHLMYTHAADLTGSIIPSVLAQGMNPVAGRLPVI